jgi:hypothetical protein
MSRQLLVAEGVIQFPSMSQRGPLTAAPHGALGGRACLALLAFAATSGLGGCGDGGSALAVFGCHLVGNVIACANETFADCSNAGCPISNLRCENPPIGCQVAPDMILAHYSEKGPNDVYLCGGQTTCGSWTETGCQVTVMPDSGTSIDYTINDATCP